MVLCPPRSADILRMENLSNSQIFVTDSVIDALLWMRDRLPSLPDGHDVYSVASRITMTPVLFYW